MKATHSFRMRRQRRLMTLAVILVTGALSACTTSGSRRDEPSPTAPQWLPFRHH